MWRTRYTPCTKWLRTTPTRGTKGGNTHWESWRKGMVNMADWKDYRALVVGCGSIGRRHAGNLKFLGLSKLAFCDTNQEALKQCSEAAEGELFSDYRDGLK